MELREFAERILFATSLEEKLLDVLEITDARPGVAPSAPSAPGRPAGLAFKASGAARDSFPGTQHLERAGERGRLLHFFANHELLATELMALVLLRFPDAPAAFRQGVLRTLRDEQEHTRLYLQRMRECGVTFGEMPVSGYFWRAVSGMESPMDFVAGLSLTFEQANLDFARHFARGFAAAGDAETAALLERIHRDEIAHVAHGLKWFRRWKNPGVGDWEAFCGVLKAPLSPQRAKGIGLDIEGRRAAGLDAEFIAELDVYARSKGRVPDVYLFNPHSEARMAGGAGFQPRRHAAQLAEDLENLPQFLCRQDDVVVVGRRPGVAFLSGLKRAGFMLPEFVEAPGKAAVPAEAFAGRRIARLRPWAWGPDSVERLRELFALQSEGGRRAEECFNESIQRLHSKAWSTELLGYFLVRAVSENPRECMVDFLCPPEAIGVEVMNMDAALAAIAVIRREGHHRVVVKESLGLAGANALRLFEPELLETQRRWMARALEDGRTLVVEPWLERVADFSAQLEMTAEGLRLIGYTTLVNDARGQFVANRAEPGFARRLPAEVLRHFSDRWAGAVRVQECFGRLFKCLEARLRGTSFLGALGVDAFVYRDAAGVARLKPVVEVNARHTMGRLTLELMGHVVPGCRGEFRLVNRAQVRTEGFGDFVSFARALEESNPVRLEGEPVPRLRAGAVCLNDPAQAQVCLAVFQVGALTRLPESAARA